MRVKVNCLYNNNGAWCRNKSVKRSFWGLGARLCSEYPQYKNGCMVMKKCPYKNESVFGARTKPARRKK
jgi:hypothetical protein